MHTLHITERTGKDGVLHVSVPLGTPNAAYDVVLVVQPKEVAFGDRRRGGMAPGVLRSSRVHPR